MWNNSLNENSSNREKGLENAISELRFKLIMQSKFASYRNNFVIDFRYSSNVCISCFVSILNPRSEIEVGISATHRRILAQCELI